MTGKRTRLTAEFSNLAERQRQIESEIAGLQREFRRLDAQMRIVSDQLTVERGDVK